MRATPTVLSRAPIIKSKSSNGLLMASETLPISESGYCLRFLTLISPLTGRTSKQLVSKSRHELLNKTYSIFSSVLLDEEPSHLREELVVTVLLDNVFLDSLWHS